MKIETELRGLEDVDRLLSQIAPRQAKNILRATVHDMAKEIRDDARDGMPKDEGTLKKATRHKRERGTPSTIESTVRVSKAAFYWRFLEYGDGPDGVAYDFFYNATQKMRAQMMQRFLVSFGKKFEAAAARAGKRAG